MTQTRVSWRTPAYDSAADATTRIDAADCAVLKYWAGWIVLTWSAPLAGIALGLLDYLFGWTGDWAHTLANAVVICSVAAILFLEVVERRTA